MDRRDADLFLVEALSVRGNAFRQLERPTEAASALRRALTLAGAYPDEPLRIAAACQDLALLSQWTGNFLEAEYLLRRALAIVEGSDEKGGAMTATAPKASTRRAGDS
jgi:tetratricopeptide (TPR) repeat protein